MTKLEKSTRLSSPVDALMRVLTDPEAVVQRELDRGALDAEVLAPERAKGHYRYQLHSTKYGRTMTGGVDKSKTTRQVTTYDWDLDAKRCTFVTDTGHGERVKVVGTMHAEPDGDGAKLTFGMKVDVRMPVVGKGIEKLVGREFDKSWPEFEAALRRGLVT